MATGKIAEAGRAILSRLDELIGDRAEAYREKLLKLLREADDGRNVDARLLELLYSRPESRQWLARRPADGEPESRPSRRGLAPDFGVTGGGKRTEAVQFSAYSPATIAAEAWSDLLAYVHLPDALEAVREDSRRQLRASGAHGVTQANASGSIKRGAEIRVVPGVPHCQTNPPQASVLWLEDWRRLSFRVRVEEGATREHLGVSQLGRLSFHIGPLLVGEVPFIATLAETAPADPPALSETPAVSAYRKIFCSYSHKDQAIVERLEAAYLALGDDYRRDVRKLRSGQDWNAEIGQKIEPADIFQLFWSPEAKASKEVEKEWRAADELDRPHFIRPVYWREPIPKPPPELNRLHFTKLDPAS